VWAPNSEGFKVSNNALIVNYPAYYSNVDVIAFHSSDTGAGPVDAQFGYTNTEGMGVWLSTDSNDEYIASIYPDKPFANTEAHPVSPDPLGKTSSWWIVESDQNGYNVNRLWTWQTMTFRHWKSIVLWRSTSVLGFFNQLGMSDYGIGPGSSLSNALADDIAGWDTIYDNLGTGPLPIVDGQAMLSWWMNGGTPLTNWLSGTPLYVVNPLGDYTSGTPGLHFWTWKFADGSTNTFVWADEQIAVTTNFGVGLTDIFSNQWSSSIGIEPVIAWRWPPSITKTSAVAPAAPPASLVVQ